MSLVGEYIDAYCPKCELTLAHVVLFELKGVVSRVKCRTCGTEHKFRGRKPEVKRTGSVFKNRSQGASKRSIAQKGGHSVDIARWQENRNRLGTGTEMKTYRISESYAKGDVIDHDTFGIGFVEKVISETRMDVLFSDGLRRMTMHMKG
jgi:hypothetical protein